MVGWAACKTGLGAQIVALRKKGHSFVHLLSPPSSTYLFSSDAAAAADAAP